ncbi:MAG: glycosyltransferase [Armatimonadota bacterium]
MAPLISVIIPVYNVEPYLRRCVDSVLAQTYTQLEVILVDDGSPDSCGQICDGYSLADSRVKVIHQENGGLSAARNTGLRHAAGDYIGFVDSDDIIDSDMYAALYRAMEENDADIAVCQFLCFDREEDIKPGSAGETSCSTNIEYLHNYFTPRCGQATVCVNKLYRRHLFSDIEFPPGFIHEDEFVTHKLIYRAKRIAAIERELYYYRQTSGSIMQAPFSEKRLVALRAFQERIEFYKSNGLTELADLTECSYASLLMKFYCQAKANPQSQKCASRLNEEFCRNYSQFLSNPALSRCKRISLRLFKLSPVLYNAIMAIRKKLSR